MDKREFWQAVANLPAERRVVVPTKKGQEVGLDFYYIGDEDKKGMRGFGGVAYFIAQKDEDLTFTTNLFYKGELFFTKPEDKKILDEFGFKPSGKTMSFDEAKEMFETVQILPCKILYAQRTETKKIGEIFAANKRWTNEMY